MFSLLTSLTQAPPSPLPAPPTTACSQPLHPSSLYSLSSGAVLCLTVRRPSAHPFRSSSSGAMLPLSHASSLPPFFFLLRICAVADIRVTGIFVSVPAPLPSVTTQSSPPLPSILLRSCAAPLWRTTWRRVSFTPFRHDSVISHPFPSSFLRSCAVPHWPTSSRQASCTTR